MNQDMLGYHVELWKSPDEVRQIEYGGYWNNEAIEKDKDVFWIFDGNFQKMESYLEDADLLPQFRQITTFIRDTLHRSVKGTGADLAAGNLWAVPLLLKAGTVDKVYAVEYSQHRLLKIGPQLLRHYQVQPEQVALCLGSFYELKLPDHSLDFVFMAQAFHHADNPARLLAEIRRVIKPEGLVIILGEHIVSESNTTPQYYARHFIKYLVARLLPSNIQQWLFKRRIQALTPFPEIKSVTHDKILGDHHYVLQDYHRMFKDGGFVDFHLHETGSSYQSFLLIGEEV